jgi:DNA-binding transcriptional ArsR family regulator
MVIVIMSSPVLGSVDRVVTDPARAYLLFDSVCIRYYTLPKGKVNVNRDHSKIDFIFIALSDNVRRSMIEFLQSGEKSVSSFAYRYSMTLAGAMKHLNILERAGIVESRKVGRARLYRLRSLSMNEAIDWMERYQCFWETTLQHVQDYVERRNGEGSEGIGHR